MGIIALTQFGLAALSPKLPGTAAPRATPPRTNDQNLFSNKLEARLDNLKSGRDGLFDFSVDTEIAERDAAVHDTLANQDPKALQSYSSLLTGLGYNSSARIVNSVEYVTRTLASIPTKEEAKALTDKVVAAYKANQTHKDARQKAENALDAVPSSQTDSTVNSATSPVVTPENKTISNVI